MFLAMNRFTVPDEHAEAFEAMWLGRESHLTKEPGFVEFHMMKGPRNDGATLYASHTIWASEADFTAWTRSASFRAAHANAGAQGKLYTGHPTFEGFTSIQRIGG